ncbi:MAG: nitrate reductase molybdenum cofactor assembly chaperone [Burkholderiaceae bacterium]
MSKRVDPRAVKAVAVLLSYPTEATVEALPELRAALGGAARLQPLFDLLAGDLFDAQEAYVETFDRGRRTSLNLFEHVHGESRDRGQAMVDLLQVYEEAGLQMTVRQLPDYLPVFLDFVSTREPKSAREHLREVTPLVADIGEGLARRVSPWKPLVDVLLTLAGEPTIPDREAPVEDEELTPAALDAAWESAPAFDACPPVATRPETQPIHLVRRAA